MVLAWWFTSRHVQRDVAYIIQSILAALIFTPWYVFPDQDYMAPALMVFMMDTITISPELGIRGLIPLVMALLFALLVSIMRSVFVRVLYKRRLKQQVTVSSDQAD